MPGWPDEFSFPGNEKQFFMERLKMTIKCLMAWHNALYSLGQDHGYFITISSWLSSNMIWSKSLQYSEQKPAIFENEKWLSYQETWLPSRHHVSRHDPKTTHVCLNSLHFKSGDLIAKIVFFHLKDPPDS